jgi:hypothetical protein
MHDEILAATDRRRIVAVGVQPARVRVERIIVVHLLVKGHARISAEIHQRAAGGPYLPAMMSSSL